jgi:hypothetical protein
MKLALSAALARMPARQLTLGLRALQAIAAALLWALALRAPLATLALQAEQRAQLAANRFDRGQLERQRAALALRLAALGRLPGQPSAQAGLDQLQATLIGAVERAAARHGVRLSGASPGPTRKLALFHEVSFEVGASGSYPGLLEWLVEIERTLPTLAILRFDLRGGTTPGPLEMKIRLAAYLVEEAPP